MWLWLLMTFSQIIHQPENKFSGMYTAALAYISSDEVKHQSQFRYSQVLLHLPQQTTMGFKESTAWRGASFLSNPLYSTCLPSYHSRSFGFHVKLQLLKLSYFMLKGKWKLRHEPSLIFRHNYHRVMLLCFLLQFRLLQFPTENRDCRTWSS